MNNKGFANLFLIIWMPVVATTHCCFGFTWWFLNQKNIMNNICAEGVMKAQEELVRFNNQIMGLNKRAQSLYYKKKTLDIIIRTAPPQVKVMALAARTKVVTEQFILKGIQQGLFATGQVRAQSHLFRMRNKLDNRKNKIREYWRAKTTTMPTPPPLTPSSKLKVKLYDIAPVYKRGFKHWQSQGLSMHWQVPLRAIIPKWSQPFLFAKKHRWAAEKWTGECHSHPHKGDRQWRAALGKGNH